MIGSYDYVTNNGHTLHIEYEWEPCEPGDFINPPWDEDINILSAQVHGTGYDVLEDIHPKTLKDIEIECCRHANEAAADAHQDARDDEDSYEGRRLDPDAYELSA